MNEPTRVCTQNLEVLKTLDLSVLLLTGTVGAVVMPVVVSGFQTLGQRLNKTLHSFILYSYSSRQISLKQKSDYLISQEYNGLP